MMLQVVTLYNGIQVFWDGIKTVLIRMPTWYEGSICGICGNYDGVDNELALGPHVMRNLPACPALAPWGIPGEQVRLASSPAE